MADTVRTLFNPIVEEMKLNPKFQSLRTIEANAPARWMLDQVYAEFPDPDGNFLEQFQTTGFNTRYFELYLYAYFARSGFKVDRPHPNPDFIVSRNGQCVAVEATTVNPATSGAVEKYGKRIEDLSAEELQSYQRDELCIRLGSPLLSKLQKKYWELEHCREMPFVIAIEAFHDDDSLSLSHYALGRYVFGLEQTAEWTSSGNLSVEGKRVSEHKLGNKTIPSGFFDQPETEHVSAVIFTNSGTNAKFGRMGFQHGIGNDTITIIREGLCYNPHPDARDPTLFAYNLDSPPFVESWGQGIIVLHNPKALHPVSMDFFVDAVQGHMKDGLMATIQKSWHPMTSMTLMINLGDAKKNIAKLPFRTPSYAIMAITKQEFQEVAGIVNDENPILQEHGWFSDDTHSFLGVLVFDKTDDDWGFVILARDMCGQFRAIVTDVSMPLRQDAREKLQTEIAKLVLKPKRIF